MAHPHQSMLDEYKFAIEHLVPTVPEEVKKEALEMHQKLSEDKDAPEGEIRRALAKTGEAEYPYRKAYKQLVGEESERRMNELVLEHVEDNVRKKIEPHLKAGVDLNELVKSDLFESELTAEERYQVEDGILDAKDHVREEMEKITSERADEYQKMVANWQAHAKKIEAKINELEALKSRDKEGKWGEEIDARVARFWEGFLVTERDPELEEVEKEIEYWIGTFGEEL